MSEGSGRLFSEKMLSIVIPVYNCQDYLGNTINSVLEQCIDDLQIIIVDDGSSDRSGAIAEEYSKKYEYIEVIHIKNQGVSHARNMGLERVTGEWVYFMDSDDIMINEMGQLLKKIKSSCYDMIVFAAEFFYANNDSVVIHRANPCNIHNREEMKLYLQGMNQECKDVFLNYLWNRLFKRSIINENHICFDESVNLGEDFLFITKYFRYSTNICIVDKAYYRYFIRGGNSLVSRFDINEAKRRKIMRNAFKGFLDFYGINALDTPIYVLNEGMNLVTSIKKVTKKNCPLSDIRNKLDYIGSFLNSDNVCLMKRYLRSNSTISSRAFYFGLLTKNKTIIYLICVLEHRYVMRTNRLRKNCLR